MKKIEVLLLMLSALASLHFLTSCIDASEESIPYETGKDDLTYITSNAPQIAENILAIYEDKEGHMWFGTAEHGVAHYDGNNLNYYTKENGFCGTSVANIIEDQEGDLWFGTYEDMCRLDEASRFKTPSFVPLSNTHNAKMLGQGWKSVRRYSNGAIWVNTHHGMFEYKQNGLTQFTYFADKKIEPSFCNTPGMISLDYIDSEGKMWFGSDNEGVYVFDGSRYTHYTTKDGLPSNSVLSITEDKNGGIWIACRNRLNGDTASGGLAHFDGQKFITYPQHTGLTKNNIYTVSSDNHGNVYIGATGTGIYKYDGQALSLIQEPEGMKNNESPYVQGLQSVYQDRKGRVWMGFSGGLYRLSGNELINITKSGPWDS